MQGNAFFERKPFANLLLACEQALPRVEMRACNNHGGKAINAHF